MPKKSSRTLKMMEEFMALHEAGHSIPEIAKLTGVEYSTIYNHLGEIAEKNGVTRESLLMNPHPNRSTDRAPSKTGVYQLNAKMLRELTKRGYTFDDFCQRYSCNRHDLEARVRTLLRNDKRSANEAINEIVFNTKKKKGKVFSEPTQVVTPEVVDRPEANPPADEVATLSVEERLSALNQQKQDLMEKSNEAAGRYADADRGYGKACNHLSELEGQISELRARLASCEAEKAETIEKQTKFLAERQSAMKERETLATETVRVNQEISKLTTIQLIACEDGTIEAVDAPDFVLNEEGAGQYYDILVHDLRFKEFKMKDVSLMARAMAIRKNAEGNWQIAITFDNEGLGELFANT